MRKSQMKTPAILVIFALVLIPGCVQQADQTSKNPDVEIVNFSTDKSIYGSYEEIKISLVVRSSKYIENASANLFGIKPYNHAYVNESKLVNLAKGDNEIIFRAKTPYCNSGCGGVYPGPYNLSAGILINGEMAANSTTTINLVGN